MTKRSRLSRNGSKPRSTRMSNVKGWVDESSGNSIVYKSVNNPSITVEAHKFDERETEELGAKWYIYPAKNGKGIPNSPDFADTRAEAMSRVKELMEEYAQPEQKTKFGVMDSSGKVTTTHEINLAQVKSPDPLAFAYGKVQGERGESLGKPESGDKFAPEFIRGWKEGHKKFKGGS